MLATKLDETDDLAALVQTSLWGNLADLSVSAGAVLVSPEKASGGDAATDAQSAAAVAREDPEARARVTCRV